MNLSEDIVSQILLNLRVQSLLRFRSVCKDWCELIKSSFFKDTFLALRRAKAVNDEILGLKLKGYDFGYYKSFVTCWYDVYEPLALSASTPSSSSNDVEISGGFSGQTNIIDHINGIVYVKGGNRGEIWEDNIKENWFDITLVNTALREFIKLPVPDLGGDDFECYLFRVGFGYDDATNDYKLFAIVTVVELGGKEIGLVYNLSTNSWRKLGFMSEFVTHNYFVHATGEFFLSMGQESIFTHGSIHWIMRSDPNYRILTFNLTSELFQEMLFPHDWKYEDETTISSLFTIDKSTIALLAFPFPFSRKLKDNSVAQVLDIWVMKEYGDSESWTKQYSISSLPRFRTPLSFWKKDKLLLQTMDSRLICYDLFTGQAYQYEQCDPMYGYYEEGQQNEHGCGWGLQFVTGHESFVSLL